MQLPGSPSPSFANSALAGAALAAPVFRSEAHTDYSSRTNITVTAPAGIADGDMLLMLVFMYFADDNNFAFPAGFIALPGSPFVGSTDTNFRFYAGYKPASGESGDYAATFDSAALCQACVLAYSGCNPLSIDSHAREGTGGFTSFNVATTGVKTRVVMSLVDSNDHSNALSAPLGQPTRMDVAPRMFVSDISQVFAGDNDGLLSMDNNSSLGHQWISWTLALYPG